MINSIGFHTFIIRIRPNFCSLLFFGRFGWRRALGRSAIWRYYAIVVTADARDLNELLVSAGLARIYGTRTPLPDCVLALNLTNSYALVTYLS
jgi:hypothetical protein